MIKKVLIQKIQPGGLRISDEMNLMAFFGQGFAELGGYYTATPEGGVTYYTNFNLIHGVVEFSS
jgi:hypothetical protein